MIGNFGIDWQYLEIMQNYFGIIPRQTDEEYLNEEMYPV